MRYSCYAVHNMMKIQKYSKYVFFAFKPGLERIRVYLSPRRRIDVFADTDAQFLILINDVLKNAFHVEEINVYDRFTIRLDEILHSLEIEYVQHPSEQWKYIRKHISKDTLYLFENGFYVFSVGWMDCNVYHTIVLTNGGVKVGHRVLSKMFYTSYGLEPSPKYHAFLERLLTEGCTCEEYDNFKKEHIKEYGEKWQNHF